MAPHLQLQISSVLGPRHVSLLLGLRLHGPHLLLERALGLAQAPRWMRIAAHFDPVAYAVVLMRGALSHRYFFNPWLSLGALAERTHTDPSSVSVVVSRLVARGLVRRTASTEDARRAEIRLTPRGRALVLRAPEASQTRLVEALSALEEDTRTALGNGLLSLVASMNLRGAPRMFFEDDPSAQTKKEKANRAHD